MSVQQPLHQQPPTSSSLPMMVMAPSNVNLNVSEPMEDEPAACRSNASKAPSTVSATPRPHHPLSMVIAPTAPNNKSVDNASDELSGAAAKKDSCPQQATNASDEIAAQGCCEYCAEPTHTYPSCPHLGTIAKDVVLFLIEDMSTLVPLHFSNWDAVTFDEVCNELQRRSGVPAASINLFASGKELPGNVAGDLKAGPHGIKPGVVIIVSTSRGWKCRPLPDRSLDALVSTWGANETLLAIADALHMQKLHQPQPQQRLAAQDTGFVSPMMISNEFDPSTAVPPTTAGANVVATDSVNNNNIDAPTTNTLHTVKDFQPCYNNIPHNNSAGGTPHEPRCHPSFYSASAEFSSSSGAGSDGFSGGRRVPAAYQQLLAAQQQLYYQQAHDEYSNPSARPQQCWPFASSGFEEVNGEGHPHGYHQLQHHAQHNQVMAQQLPPQSHMQFQQHVAGSSSAHFLPPTMTPSFHQGPSAHCNNTFGNPPHPMMHNNHQHLPSATAQHAPLTEEESVEWIANQYHHVFKQHIRQVLATQRHEQPHAAQHLISQLCGESGFSGASAPFPPAVKGTDSAGSARCGDYDHHQQQHQQPPCDDQDLISEASPEATEISSATTSPKSSTPDVAQGSASQRSDTPSESCDDTVAEEPEPSSISAGDEHKEVDRHVSEKRKSDVLTPSEKPEAPSAVSAPTYEEVQHQHEDEPESPCASQNPVNNNNINNNVNNNKEKKQENVTLCERENNATQENVPAIAATTGTTCATTTNTSPTPSILERITEAANNRVSSELQVPSESATIIAMKSHFCGFDSCDSRAQDLLSLSMQNNRALRERVATAVVDTEGDMSPHEHVYLRVPLTSSDGTFLCAPKKPCFGTVVDYNHRHVTLHPHYARVFSALSDGTKTFGQLTMADKCAMVERTVHLNFIPMDCHPDSILDLFVSFGPVMRVRICLPEYDDGRAKDFYHAFCEFADCACVDMFMRHCKSVRVSQKHYLRGERAKAPITSLSCSDALVEELTLHSEEPVPTRRGGTRKQKTTIKTVTAARKIFKVACFARIGENFINAFYRHFSNPLRQRGEAPGPSHRRYPLDIVKCTWYWSIMGNIKDELFLFFCSNKYMSLHEKLDVRSGKLSCPFPRVVGLLRHYHHRGEEENDANDEAATTSSAKQLSGPCAIQHHVGRSSMPKTCADFLEHHSEVVKSGHKMLTATRIYSPPAASDVTDFVKEYLDEFAPLCLPNDFFYFKSASTASYSSCNSLVMKGKSKKGNTSTNNKLLGAMSREFRATVEMLLATVPAEPFSAVGTEWSCDEVVEDEPREAALDAPPPTTSAAAPGHLDLLRQVVGNGTIKTRSLDPESDCETKEKMKKIVRDVIVEEKEDVEASDNNTTDKKLSELFRSMKRKKEEKELQEVLRKHEGAATTSTSPPADAGDRCSSVVNKSDPTDPPTTPRDQTSTPPALAAASTPATPNLPQHNTNQFSCTNTSTNTRTPKTPTCQLGIMNRTPDAISSASSSLRNQPPTAVKIQHKLEKMSGSATRAVVDAHFSKSPQSVAGVNSSTTSLNDDSVELLNDAKRRARAVDAAVASQTPTLSGTSTSTTTTTNDNDSCDSGVESNREGAPSHSDSMEDLEKQLSVHEDVLAKAVAAFLRNGVRSFYYEALNSIRNCVRVGTRLLAAANRDHNAPASHVTPLDCTIRLTQVRVKHLALLLTTRLSQQEDEEEARDIVSVMLCDEAIEEWFNCIATQLRRCPKLFKKPATAASFTDGDTGSDVDGGAFEGPSTASPPPPSLRKTTSLLRTIWNMFIMMAAMLEEVDPQAAFAAMKFVIELCRRLNKFLFVECKSRLLKPTVSSLMKILRVGYPASLSLMAEDHSNALKTPTASLPSTPETQRLPRSNTSGNGGNARTSPPLGNTGGTNVTATSTSTDEAFHTAVGELVHGHRCWSSFTPTSTPSSSSAHQLSADTDTTNTSSVSALSAVNASCNPDQRPSISLLPEEIATSIDRRILRQSTLRDTVATNLSDVCTFYLSHSGHYSAIDAVNSFR